MLTGKKVLVIGLARSGNAAVHLLQKLNATITINEGKNKEDIKEYDEYVSQGIEMVTGGHPDELFERDFDFVIKNPGINYHKPFILRLKERHIPVYTEIELAYQVAKKQHYIAVTGTNGKTTTVTLIYEILKNQYSHVHYAGNIGKPLCDVVLENNLLEEENHYIVLEMSNFQLLDIDKFRPEFSTIINLTPDHLDYMASLDEYYASKTNIYKNCQDDDVYVCNLDDETLKTYLDRYPVKCKQVTQSLKQDATCHIKDQAIYYQNEHIIDLDEIKIVGDHNVQNIMLASALCKLAGVSNQVLHDTIAAFNGVEHRIEYVNEINGVKIYNDSKATNTDASIIALKAFKQPVILLMGGFEKGLDLTELASYNDHIKYLVTFGVAGQRFKQDMHHPHSDYQPHLKEAVDKALEVAQPGDIILLSPSTSSFDEFSGYEQRGTEFKKMINEKCKK
ncbi:MULTISPECIES: UDP-N-acetylmuramoyl-L-alanine--D-glutamate ligase [Coprobacillaceae]|uniref:UDP-N-acetylmuramoyl-L-alanine--D-glutamate ligase n=1 Tax=Coprobacillaceae TaxID=2810280 RepID=UPI000E4F84CF|nr:MULTISPECIES: UDP-N-acetylmuramoyl-L-alanine--D-glutamate ligase [Coprobacillaceae]RHM62884.1 UDP-N-acetylmuramoyl-L-alanine--D-glutamate ligase [Coprobacillus sp. AF33-1AC]RHS94975.1 UDP-N-acetylmuramoyl-L-alanine--D-glutamate ligase [Erysipelatoclostridium sp. AM42-17]